MRTHRTGALAIIVPIKGSSSSALSDLATTISSLDKLTKEGLVAELVLVGDAELSAAAEHWLLEHMPNLNVRQVEMIWADDWAVFETAGKIGTSYFAVLHPGCHFEWPAELQLADIAEGTLCFAHTNEKGHLQQAFWASGSLAPMQLGEPLSTPIWHAGLCERAAILLECLSAGRQLTKVVIDPWRAYLAVNEERLAGVHRLIQY